MNELATFGEVHIESVSAEAAIHFWHDILGLHLRSNGDAIEFGTEKATLVVVHPVAKIPQLKGHTGLYHLAIHPPNETEFARILARLITKGYPISPTDHTLSKAIYMEDPDGMTVEVTLETPERYKEMVFMNGRPMVIDSEGNPHSGVEPLDIEEVLSHAPEEDHDQLLHHDSKIGHIHLYVNTIEKSYEFYKKLGFIENSYMPEIGMGDLSAGGTFKHRMAMNTWMGADATPAPEGSARMRYFTIRFDTAERLEDTIKQFENINKTSDGYMVHDPVGNKIFLSSK